MNQDKLHEIARLLDAFYAGDISGEDQSRLIALLRDGDDLPDHFIADRDLILSLHRPAPEMPQHLKSRVDAALQGEMRRTRFRRAGIIAGSMAASLIAIFATAGFWRES
ncbi:MAG: hypothetical protein K2N88_07785, partial [Muribaculaceae bacterium]|nr:hypothetical protein [Muribaculaceae bacterium]